MKSEKTYTPQMLRERAFALATMAETWTGYPHADLQTMDAWALEIAAALLEAARRVVDDNPKSLGWTDTQKQQAAHMVCDAVHSGELNLAAMLQ